MHDKKISSYAVNNFVLGLHWHFPIDYYILILGNRTETIFNMCDNIILNFNKSNLVISTISGFKSLFLIYNSVIS